MRDTFAEMPYVRIFLIAAWLLLCSTAGLLLALFGGPFHPDYNRLISRTFARGALRIARIRVKLEGEHFLTAHQPCVYVANHQSALDILTLGSVCPPRTLALGKKELLWIPVFGLYFALSNILVDRRNPRNAILALRRAVDAIKTRRESIWFFAEGTRNRDGEEMLPFKKGAFRVAIEAGVPIVPVVAAPVRELYRKKPLRLPGGKTRLRVLPPVRTAGCNAKNADELAESLRESMMKAFRGLAAESGERPRPFRP